MIKELADWTKPDILATTGDPLWRHDNMLMRRRVAALCGQHRVVQRLDKQLSILRAALGLPILPPEQLVRTHVTSKDPLGNNDLEIATWDATWARKVTTQGLARLTAYLSKRGYSVNRSTNQNHTIVRCEGRIGGARDVIELSVLTPSFWCTSAVRNGSRLSVFDFAPEQADEDRGIPAAIASATWDGTIDGPTAQAYARSWTALSKILT